MNRRLPFLLVCLTLSVSMAGAQPISARKALMSLKALQAVLGADLDYAEYDRRLADARRGFERYVERKSVTIPEAEAKTAMSAAMNYHRFAQSLWSTRLKRSGDLSLSSFDTRGVLVERFPCPALKSVVDTVMETYRESRGDSERGAIVVDRRWSDRVVPVLWSCASDRIAEAERIIGTTTR